MKGHAVSKQELLSELHLRDAEINSLRTRLLHAEDEIRASEERQRTILDNPMFAIGLSDGNQILYANRPLLELFGYENLDEFISISLIDHVAQSSRATILDRLEKTATGVPLDPNFVYDIRRKDGSVRKVEITVVPSRWKGRQCRFSLFRDITERRRTEEALRESEAMLNRTQEIADVSSWELDLRTGAIIWSKQAYRQLGERPDDFIPSREVFEQHVYHEDWMAVQTAMERALAEGEPFDLDFRIVRSDGEIRILRTRGEVVCGPDGRPHRLHGASIDITESRKAEEELSRREEWLRLFIDNAPAALAMFDRQMRFMNVSRRWLKDVGLEGCDLRGLSHYEVFPNTSDRWRDAHRRGLAGEVVKAEDDKLQRADGSTKWLRWEVHPWHDATGQIAGIVVFSEDITERKRAEVALRGSEERLAQIFNSASNAMAIAEPTKGLIIDANESWFQLTGYSREESIGKSSLDLNLWSSKVDRKACIAELTQTGRIKDFETILTAKSKKATVLLSAIMIKLGNAQQALWELRDITERKQAEEELRRSEERLRSVLDGSRDVIYRVNVRSGLYEYISPACQTVVGFTPDELQAQDRETSFAMIHPEDVFAFRSALKSIKAAGIDHAELEYRQRAKDGTYRWLSNHISIVRDSDGRPLYRDGCIRDITERKRAEEENAKLALQLQQAQKMESVGRLAGGIAHDFNNMLGVILGNAEIALDQIDPAQPIYDGLKEIQNAGKRSADLTRQLLAFARKQTITPKVLDLNETIAGMLKMLKRMIGENILLNWLPTESLWLVMMDPSQLDQILANLCVNARDAIHDTGKITIGTRNRVLDEDFCESHVGCVPGEYVQLTVSDDGFGMDGETLGQIFEPFFTTKGVGVGTGLGLSTVYGAIKQNNGFIYVDSAPGLGTTITIYLPRLRDKAEARQARMEVPGPSVSGQEIILLVEDEPAILKLVATMLQKCGYTVMAASTPGEAIRLAREHTGEIHLLMTDVIMPEMNGRSLAKKLLPLYPHLKRLFMSGYTADVIAHHGVLDEGVGFIQKPFSEQSLANKVKEVLDSE